MAEKLTKDIIPTPKLWRLYLEIKSDAIEVLIYSALLEQSLKHYRIDLDPAASSKLTAFQDAIYENPLLLAEFERTHILIDTCRFMMMPIDFEDTALETKVMGEFFNDPDVATIANPLPATGTKIVMGVEQGLKSFITRTFPTANVRHPLWALSTYFCNKDRLTNASKMYVHLRPGYIDIVYYSDAKLNVANTFEVASIEDILYYVMMAIKVSKFDQHNDELMLCGVPALREKVAPILRKYINYVMPVVFPSMMYHAGKDALESPFELIIMPLCE